MFFSLSCEYSSCRVFLRILIAYLVLLQHIFKDWSYVYVVIIVQSDFKIFFCLRLLLAKLQYRNAHYSIE